jgi:SAM-dependent methyltransferase
MVSKAYDEALQDSIRHHQTSKTFSGSLAFHHAEAIKDVINAVGATTVLDYGCGKGIQYEGEDSLETLWGVPVTKYDPAIERFAREPDGSFDLVICTHSLGCVPVDDMPAIIDRVYRRATKAVYVGELIGSVKKKVFRHPERFAYGWAAADWARALRRDRADMPAKVYLGVLRDAGDGLKLRVQTVGALRS